MRNIILLFATVLLANIVEAQTFTVFDVDTSSYPTMKAKFYAFDENNDPIFNLSSSDFNILENGEVCNIIDVTCPNPTEPVAISSVLIMDVSGSMMGDRLDLAKEAAKSWINALPLGKSECAITAFDKINYLLQDFSTSRSLLLEKTNRLFAKGVTSYDAALINPMAGGLLISKSGKYKKVIVFLTDGQGDISRLNEIVSEAQNQNTIIFTVTLGMACPNVLKYLTEQTGGQWFEGISTVEEAKLAYLQILETAQGSAPCEILWQSEIPCSPNIATKITCLPINKTNTFQYSISNNNKAGLDFNPSYLDFGELIPEKSKDLNITVTAKNTSFTVTDIIPTNAEFSINPSSFTLAENESKDLTITFTPSDSSYSYCGFNFDVTPCQAFYAVVGGFSNMPPEKSTIELTHPNGGEEFLVGIDTAITWKGVLETDSVTLSLSRDNGKSWEDLSNTASGLSYDWQNISPPTSNECLVKVNRRNVPASMIEWQKCLGGSALDDAYSIIQTLDGGYIVAGYTKSNDGDISGNHGNSDYWIVKLNKARNIEWQKCLGGSGFDEAYSIIQTLDGGYIIAGWTTSNDGDITGYHDERDCWVVKLDVIGDVEWQKCLGGSSFDEAYSIIQTLDGGYIITGRTESTDGDITENHGESDVWVVKLTNFGEIQWQKCLGGSGYDEGFSIVQTLDGGYIIAGFTKSDDGDVTGFHGSLFHPDCWVVKLNNFGDIQWQKCLGGSNGDIAFSIIQTSDRGYIMAGWTGSIDGDVKGFNGWSDFWVVKLNNSGDIEWQKCLGGSISDRGYSIIQTRDGGYIVTGTTCSSDSDVTGKHGQCDCWTVKLNNIGEIQWQKCLGGSDMDGGRAVIQTLDGGYIVAGVTESNDGDVIGSHGEEDFWIVKLYSDWEQEDISDATFSIVLAEINSDDINMGEAIVNSTKDSVFTDFVVNISNYPCRVDSIYSRE